MYYFVLPLLLLVIVLLAIVWEYLAMAVNSIGKGLGRLWRRNSLEETPLEEPLEDVARSMPDVFLAPEHVARPLVVKDLNVDNTQATIIIRYRARKKACTGHLIVWSGAKRRRIQDSYYDLGVLSADQVDDAVVEQFLGAATQKLEDLKKAAMEARRAAVLARKEKARSSVVEPTLENLADLQQVAPPAVEVATEAEVIAEPPVNTIVDGEVKLKKRTTIYRGEILEIGMMPRTGDNGPYEVFGVRYRKADGTEDARYGANLRDAIREAMAGVGDTVEMLQVGRKTVKKGRAPMGLWQVYKLSTEQ